MQPVKTNHATSQDCCTLAFCDGPHSLCAACFSLNLNKSTLYLSLRLSLYSFCDKTSRTWASLGPETRYCGFWLGSSPSHMASSPNLCFSWVWFPAHELKSQSKGNSFLWWPKWDSDKLGKCLELGLGPKEVHGTPWTRYTGEDSCNHLPIFDWWVTPYAYGHPTASRSRTELLLFLTLWFFSYILELLFIPAFFPPLFC